jgi:membrane protein implicated in regulation of membrane protease activity
MSAAMLWFVLAFVLVVVELLTGTFYVLMVALAVAAGGVMAWLGAANWLQFLGAAVTGTSATLLLRRSRLGRASRHPDPSTDTEQNFDLGQQVAVDRWNSDGTARVQYRGTQWDAVLAEGESQAQGPHYICAIHGARLTLTARPT